MFSFHSLLRQIIDSTTHQKTVTSAIQLYVLLGLKKIQTLSYQGFQADVREITFILAWGDLYVLGLGFGIRVYPLNRSRHSQV